MQYHPMERPDGSLRERMRHWAAKKPRWGLPILHDVLKSEGMVINRKRTARIYREEGLSLRLKKRKKLPALVRVPLPVAARPNERWSMDFIHDQLSGGRRFRCMTLVDDCTRQCLSIHVDTSIGGVAVAELLDTLCNSLGHLPPSPVTMVPSSPERLFTSGLRGVVCTSITSNPANRPRTPSSNPLTAPSAMTVLTNTGLAPFRKPVCSSITGETNTTILGLIVP